MRSVYGVDMAVPNPRPDDLAVDLNYAIANVAERYGIAVSEAVLDDLAFQVRASLLAMAPGRVPAVGGRS